MIGVAVVLLALGQDAYTDTFLEGSTAYQAGNYDAAIVAFETLIDEGVADPVVFYNLGNAYFQRDRLGAAIASYERALQQRPSFGEARSNLRLAVEATEQEARRPIRASWQQSILFWDQGLGLGTVLWTALVLWGASWILLAVHTLRPVPGARLLVPVGLALSLLFGLSAWAKSNPEPLAVADADVVEVRFGPAADNPVSFELRAGERVVVDDRRPGWIRVRNLDGQRGWANAQDVIEVGPPYRRPQRSSVVQDEASDEAARGGKG